MDKFDKTKKGQIAIKKVYSEIRKTGQDNVFTVALIF
ncbi:hypothetical protein ES705_28128 [subsurface metagenome]